MYKDFREFVDKNLTSLTRTTSDILTLNNLFVEHEVISPEEREDIEAENAEFRKVTKLWNILKTKGEESVSKIIKCLKESHCARSLPESLEKYLEGQTEPNIETLSLDSDNLKNVSSKHIAPIAKLLHQNILLETWEEVKNAWLTTEMLNSVGNQSSVKLDIQKSIQIWSQKTGKKERLFSAIIKAFRDESADNIAELLEDHLEEWKAIK